LHINSSARVFANGVDLIKLFSARSVGETRGPAARTGIWRDGNLLHISSGPGELFINGQKASSQNSSFVPTSSSLGNKTAVRPEALTDGSGNLLLTAESIAINGKSWNWGLESVSIAMSDRPWVDFPQASVGPCASFAFDRVVYNATNLIVLGKNFTFSAKTQSPQVMTGVFSAGVYSLRYLEGAGYFGFWGGEVWCGCCGDFVAPSNPNVTLTLRGETRTSAIAAEAYCRETQGPMLFQLVNSSALHFNYSDTCSTRCTVDNKDGPVPVTFELMYACHGK